jgi:hypothetical protein
VRAIAVFEACKGWRGSDDIRVLLIVLVVTAQNTVEVRLGEFSAHDVDGVATRTFNVLTSAVVRMKAPDGNVDTTLTGLNCDSVSGYHLLVRLVHFTCLPCRDVCPILYKPGTLCTVQNRGRFVWDCPDFGIVLGLSTDCPGPKSFVMSV